MKRPSVHTIYAIVILIMLALAIWFNYIVATSDLPLWVKFWLLK